MAIARQGKDTILELLFLESSQIIVPYLSIVLLSFLQSSLDLVLDRHEGVVMSCRSWSNERKIPVLCHLS